MTEYAGSRDPTAIVGIESRGFIFGTPVALNLQLPFVPIRKLGKLPGETVSVEYALEYGANTVEMHKDCLQRGDRVVIVDDLLATGGTAAAAIQLIEGLGAQVVGMVVMVELGFLEGRAAIGDCDFKSLIEY